MELVAEISCNHNKSKSLLESILNPLLNCDYISCVKFQAFTAKACTSRRRDFKLDSGLWSGSRLYTLMQDAETPMDLLNYGADMVRSYKKKLMLSINSFDDYTRIEHFNPDYVKLPSPESLDYELGKQILQQNQNLVISTGVMSINELAEIYSKLSPSIVSQGQLTILHCISEYPTVLRNVNLSKLNLFKSICTEANLGISDHSTGSLVPLVATGMGISMVEKHVMSNDRGIKTLDSEFSMTVNEFLELAQQLSEATLALGSSYPTGDGAKKSTNFATRISAHSKKTIRAGTRLQKDHIEYLRPGDGISPLEIPNFIGQPLKHDIGIGEPITYSSFDEVI